MGAFLRLIDILLVQQHQNCSFKHAHLTLDDAPPESRVNNSHHGDSHKGDSFVNATVLPRATEIYVPN
jgi:hypothetical protein